MMASQIRSLSAGFEVGAHTLSHAVLTDATADTAWDEISGSKSWIEDSTGSSCTLFCPPKGRYASRHLDMVRRAGFLGLRSAELLSLDFPRHQAGLLVMPTTLQAYPHGPAAFARNAIKRRAFGNLWRLILHGGSKEWPALAQSLLLHAVEHGGIFHLWGHSWELEETNQWHRLEEALCVMRWFLRQVPPLTNGQICRRVLARNGATGEALAQ
jgi:hypothetical protein